jgi:hypothetical protein
MPLTRYLNIDSAPSSCQECRLSRVYLPENTVGIGEDAIVLGILAASYTKLHKILKFIKCFS